MNTHKKLSIWYVVALLILTTTAQASTLYVATDGSGTAPYDTWAKASTNIQAAINAASASDTILVGSSGGHGTGTYTENIVVNKPVIILSELGYNTTQVVAANADAHVFEVTNDNVTIEGFSIYGATGFNMAGVYLSTVNNCVIKNNRCGWDALYKNSRGIHLFSANTCTVDSNIACYNSGEGVYVDASTQDTLRYNTVSYNTGDGIALSSSSNNTVNNNAANSNGLDGIRLVPSCNFNAINNNSASNNGNNGFLLVASADNNLTGNTANNNLATNGFYLVSSSNNTLTNDTADYNTGNGIRLESACSGNVLTYNSVAHNEFGFFVAECDNNIFNYNIMTENDGRIDGDGIMLTQSDYNTIAYNTANGDPGDGIEFYESSHNNVIGNNVIGIGGWGIRINYYSSYNVFSNNTVTDRNMGIVLEEAHTIHNTIANNTTENNTEDGIYLYNSTANNILIGNTTRNNNWYGIHLDVASNNTIFLNNLMNNTTGNVSSVNGSINTWNSPTEVYYDYDNSGTFNKGCLGNYYSDGTHTGSNGIGGTYTIPNDNDDTYQLTDSSSYYSLQTWWLNSDNDMYLDSTSKAGGNDTITNGGTHIWKDNQVALTDMNFSGTETWTGQLVFISAPTNGHTFTINIGSSTNGIDFTSGGVSAIVTGDGSSTSFTFTTNTNAFTVNAGNYLALRVTSNDAEYILKTGGAWCYTSFSGDDIITDVNNIENRLDAQSGYLLKQNLPNPFHATTSIEFFIPVAGNVEIKVFDLSGVEITTVLNEKKQAGIHSTAFNAGNLSNGIYLYKIVSGNYTQIKKMILIR